MQGKTELRVSLEEVAKEHYWRALSPPETIPSGDVISFDAIADSSVTPSRLLDRLVSIERSAKRIFEGSSRRPFADKVAELLERIGYHPDGRPMRFSGTELPGQGGSELSAVRLCLKKAINAIGRPPKPYRPKPDSRPWASQKLDGAIQTLKRSISAPDQSREEVNQTAREIHNWALWSIPEIKRMLARKMTRHHGDYALDATFASLATVYQEAFGKPPSLYRSATSTSPNPWIRFLEAALTLILYPEKPPSATAIEARWRRLVYSRA